MRFNGQFRGLVIQNNDPLQSGRVKVFVPGINLLQIKDWNQKYEEDKFFTVLGRNTGTAITTDILQEQKEKLFWAEVSLPIIGQSSPGTYNAPSDSFYIGNDSDFTFQAPNKSDALFREDATLQDSRTSENYIEDQNYISPRFSIDLQFYNLGQKFCYSSGCNSSEVPSIWQPRYVDDCLNDITKELPKTFIPTPLSGVSSTDDSSSNLINTSIISLNIEASNPTIFVNNEEVPRNSPLYNSCYSDNVPDITYNAPIGYNLVDDNPVSISYSDIPVFLSFNGRNTLGTGLKRISTNPENSIYGNDNIRVVIPTKGIKKITINKNKNKFNLDYLKSLLPLFNTISGIIFPRTPYNQGQVVYSRGGGGGELYNNVTTDLLPADVRANSHIGGANPDSTYSNNYGRTPLNDPNNIKGRNIQSNKLQLHRGPMRGPDYNNDWKGFISIPGVGSHVWVIFENGDMNYPIIIGTFAAQMDYKGIFELM